MKKVTGKFGKGYYASYNFKKSKSRTLILFQITSNEHRLIRADMVPHVMVATKNLEFRFWFTGANYAPNIRYMDWSMDNININRKMLFKLDEDEIIRHIIPEII